MTDREQLEADRERLENELETFAREMIKTGESLQRHAERVLCRLDRRRLTRKLNGKIAE